jgi:hypothetical protein
MPQAIYGTLSDDERVGRLSPKELEMCGALMKPFRVKVYRHTAAGRKVERIGVLATSGCDAILRAFEIFGDGDAVGAFAQPAGSVQ